MRNFLHILKIMLIFATWIGWSSYQPIRGKPIAPSTTLTIGSIKSIGKMAKKLTQEEFISRATQKHDGKYDYSKVKYVNTETKVCIVCPIHGDFEQRPHEHLLGFGCKKCSLPNKGRGVAHKKRRSLVYGVGINDFDGSVTETGLSKKIYKLWMGILQRCYTKINAKRRSYEDCSVSADWLYFSNFRTWALQNYVDGYSIDKDILVKSNKVYSPETCCFVPQEINSLIVGQKSRRGTLPIGVSKKGNKYRAIIRKNCKYIRIGEFFTIEEAFLAYKKEKEQHIKEVATKYFQDGKINEKVYHALMNYKVEITD